MFCVKKRFIILDIFNFGNDKYSLDKFYLNIYHYFMPNKTAQEKFSIILGAHSDKSLNQLAKDHGVAVKTLYNWRKKLLEAGSLEPQHKKGVDHHKAIPAEKVNQILDLVAAHPDVSALVLYEYAKVQGLEVSYFFIQKILERYNLRTKADRLIYAGTFRRPAEVAVTPVEPEFVPQPASLMTPNALPAPPPARLGGHPGICSIYGRLPPPKVVPILKSSGLFKFTLLFTCFIFTLVIGTLTINAVAAIITFASLYSFLGGFFALVALSAGMIFLLYSIKYYMMIISVLYFSRKFNVFQEEKATMAGDMRQKYPLLAGKYGLVPDTDGIQLTRAPFVSIHLPLYNEKRVVNRLLEAATSLEYENYEVIVCDDSTDETKEIVAQWEHHPKVKISHRDNRSGYKGAALKKALSLMNPATEFILVFDADFLPYPDIVSQFLKYMQAAIGNINPGVYGQSDIAAVQGYQWHVLNKSENWITRAVRTEYAGSYVVERSGIESYGGFKQIAGSVFMIRADILRNPRFQWDTSITEDFQLTLKLYEQGYKVVYTPYVQAPSECVSTIKRLIRQRMRWAEGHSFNIKKHFFTFLKSPYVTLVEKMEFLYLSPYYLQSFFFLIGTVGWFLSEVTFRVQLPYWTAVFGWSLVLTNLLSLPLMNTVGLFLEEGEGKDYAGIPGFLLLTYIVAPFQAFASVKGFLENEEGPWFRTPKTGRITDTFAKGKFYRFLSSFFGKRADLNTPLAYSNLQKFRLSYQVEPELERKRLQFAPGRLRHISKMAIVILLIITTTFLYFSQNVQVVEATNMSGNLKLGLGAANATGEGWPAGGNFMQNTSTFASGANLFVFSNTTANGTTSNLSFLTNLLPTSTDDASIPSGAYSVSIAKRAGPGLSNILNFSIQLLLTNADGASPSQLLGAAFSLNNANTDNTMMSYSLGSLGSAQAIKGDAPKRLKVRIYVTSVTSTTRTNVSWILNNTTLPAVLVTPADITVPEIPQKVIFVILVSIMPALPTITSMIMNRKRKKNGLKDWQKDLTDLLDRLTGRKFSALDDLPV
jgi:cellulose synthase/poly-beta-1,6-N-acetylglucosamine synthase-like glycosyltransferase/transposase